MHFLEEYYLRITKYDLLNKFSYKNINKLPKLKKLILNFRCKKFDTKYLAAIAIFLELLSEKKTKKTSIKQNHIILKLRKGSPIGCKIILNKSYMHNVFFQIISEALPKIDNVKILKLSKSKTKTISFKFKECLIFSDLEKLFYLLHNLLPTLNITIITEVKTRQELIFLLNSFKIPILNK